MALYRGYNASKPRISDRFVMGPGASSAQDHVDDYDVRKYDREDEKENDNCVQFITNCIHLKS